MNKKRKRETESKEWMQISLKWCDKEAIYLLLLSFFPRLSNICVNWFCFVVATVVAALKTRIIELSIFVGKSTSDERCVFAIYSTLGLRFSLTIMTYMSHKNQVSFAIDTKFYVHIQPIQLDWMSACVTFKLHNVVFPLLNRKFVHCIIWRWSFSWWSLLLRLTLPHTF